MSLTTTLEIDGRVGSDGDDLEFALKLADNVNAEVDLLYLNEMGELSRRTVLIDGLFGDSLDRPRYIRGFDSLRNERRTFRTDRVLAVYDGSRWEKASPNQFGEIARERREQAGLPQQTRRQIPDLEATLNLQVVIEDQGPTNDVRKWNGRLKRVSVKTVDGILNAVATFVVDPAPGGKGRRVVRYVIEPPQMQERRLIGLYDGFTGESIEDLYALASKHKA